MPDRIIRDELLESERWLALKDNADRLAYFALLLKADTFGNFDALEYRLLRLWRDFGINTLSLVAKTLAELVDHDLVRLYDANGRRYLHIPRYRQSLRYIKSVAPKSPWCDDELKQRIAKHSHGERTVPTPRPPSDHRVLTEEVRRGEERMGNHIGEKERVSARARAAPPNPVSKKVPMPTDFAISERVLDWASGKGHTRIAERFEHFVGKCRANGYTYVDWDEAFMRAIREDWAKLDQPAGRVNQRFDIHAQRAATVAAMYGNRKEQTNAEPTDITSESKRIDDD